ncbi:hypothetical protein XELAEV_18010177mg, partial [Xenopus laevis]
FTGLHSRHGDLKALAARQQRRDSISSKLSSGLAGSRGGRRGISWEEAALSSQATAALCMKRRTDSCKGAHRKNDRGCHKRPRNLAELGEEEEEDDFKEEADSYMPITGKPQH